MSTLSLLLRCLTEKQQCLSSYVGTQGLPRSLKHWDSALDEAVSSPKITTELSSLPVILESSTGVPAADAEPAGTAAPLEDPEIMYAPEQSAARRPVIAGVAGGVDRATVEVALQADLATAVFKSAGLLAASDALQPDVQSAAPLGTSPTSPSSPTSAAALETETQDCANAAAAAAKSMSASPALVNPHVPLSGATLQHGPESTLAESHTQCGVPTADATALLATDSSLEQTDVSRQAAVQLSAGLAPEAVRDSLVAKGRFTQNTTAPAGSGLSHAGQGHSAAGLPATAQVPTVSSHAAVVQTEFLYPRVAVAKTQGQRASMEDSYEVVPLARLNPAAYVYSVSPILQPIRLYIILCSYHRTQLVMQPFFL